MPTIPYRPEPTVSPEFPPSAVPYSGVSIHLFTDGVMLDRECDRAVIDGQRHDPGATVTSTGIITSDNAAPRVTNVPRHQSGGEIAAVASAQCLVVRMHFHQDGELIVADAEQRRNGKAACRAPATSSTTSWRALRCARSWASTASSWRLSQTVTAAVVTTTSRRLAAVPPWLCRRPQSIRMHGSSEHPLRGAGDDDGRAVGVDPAERDSTSSARACVRPIRPTWTVEPVSS